MASDSTYGKKPLYYGSSSSSGKSPLYYGGKSVPYYYGTQQKGGGVPYYNGAAPDAGQDPDSLVGTITLGRILRVVAQRWITILVFLLIGLVAAFAVYHISDTIYEAKAEFTMDTRRPAQANGGIGSMDLPDYGSSYVEIFNTRLSAWRSDKIVAKIIAKYHADYPASTVSDGTLMGAIGGSSLELLRNSRIITISVRNGDPQLCANLANVYAQTIETFTDEENKLRCDKAVMQIHEQVEKQARVAERVAKTLLDFRTANKLDDMKAERDLLTSTQAKETGEILTLESEITAGEEWVKVLVAAQEKPDNFGELPSSVPRSGEIAAAYSAFQRAQMEYNTLLTTFTANHPEVKLKAKQRDVNRQEFVDVVSRALATARGNLQSYRNQLAVHRANLERVRSDISAISQRIIAAESGYEQLSREQSVATALHKDLLQKENEARLVAEQNNEIISLGRPAAVPGVPILPNPTIIFAAGIIISIVAGLLFVLVLDHLEDTIVSISDIEDRLSLKVLAVLPHVRRKKREEVAKFISENKYSQFAESVAGLRNLLDSPRYQAMNQVLLMMSTQPGEGKTITSCSLATSSAQAAKKTLLVDFDLRRPRIARVWNIKIDEEHSFSHTLQRGSGKSFTDFSAIVQPSGVENLDILCSALPDGVDPASIMGSHIISDFFAWARANYDRVVIDSPPYGIVGDVMTLASMVDAVMILCCPDRTHAKPIQHASRHLMEAGATVIGVVVNDVEIGGRNDAFAPAGHHGYGYSKYRRYGYGPKGAYSPYSPYSPYGPYSPKSKKKEKSKASELSGYAPANATADAAPAAPAPEAAPAPDAAAPAPVAPAPDAAPAPKPAPKKSRWRGGVDPSLADGE